MSNERNLSFLNLINNIVLKGLIIKKNATGYAHIIIIIYIL